MFSLLKMTKRKFGFWCKYFLIDTDDEANLQIRQEKSKSIQYIWPRNRRRLRVFEKIHLIEAFE